MSARPLPFDLPVIRMGMPLVSGRLLELGVASGLPLLFSANAFARVDAQKQFQGFDLRAAAAIPAHVDAALDSAGFTAACVFGDYRWSIDQYLDLVAARKWTWWAGQDFCVEPEIAKDAAVRKYRIDATVRGYFDCERLARERGLSAPLPVVQGFQPAEYVDCLHQLALTSDVNLVGVGSVCRRHVHGPNGLLAVARALHEALPQSMAMHFFGVKGPGLVALHRTFPGRIASADSMAYDYGLRRARPTGRTQEMRAAAMVDWYASQVAALQAAARTPVVPTGCEASEQDSALDVALRAVGAAAGELYIYRDIEYSDGKWMVEQNGVLVRAVLDMHGAEAFAAEDPENDYGIGGITYQAVREALVEAGHLNAA